MSCGRVVSLEPFSAVFRELLINFNGIQDIYIQTTISF